MAASAWMTSLNAGLLPKFQLLVAIISISNSIQGYLTTKYSERVYVGTPSAGAAAAAAASRRKTAPASSSSPVTPFAARMFGNWTVLSGIIRLYCALHISDPLVYQLALWTYGVVIAHYSLEMFVFGTTGPAAGRAIVGPVVIGPTALVWMLMQWGYYVR